MIEVRVPGEDDVEAIFRLDGRAFAEPWKPEDLARQRTVMEFDRFRIAVDDGATVGVAGSYALQMTVPGGRALPTGGVTFVAVAFTHSRQGVLTRLMVEVHRDIDARGEPLAALTASEGGIYERFGYGVATSRRITVLDRRRAQLATAFRPARRTVSTVEWDDPALPDELAARWERICPLRAGEISRSAAWLRAQVGDRGADATWVLHDDGFASWKVTAQWNDGHPAHELELHDLAAVTPDGHVALWDAVLSVDFVGPIRSRVLALDDPLPYLLTDPRALRTVELNDMVWCHVRDVAACFAARSYGTDDELVVESAGSRWQVGGDGCRKVRSRPDLVAEPSALGPLLMGVAPSVLVAGRRLTAASPGVLRRADAMFTAHPSPHGMSGF
ncbi:GNAT family N-acetyltransferase [soil metagenome]